MKELIKKRHRRRWGWYFLLSPIILFFVLGILIYIPPFQKFVVNRVTAGLSESVGVDVSVEKVRLAFPLDLAVHGVVAKEKADTLADIRAMRLNVRMWPLFKGMVEVDGLELYDAKLDTKSLVSDVYVRGNIGKLTAASHGIDLEQETVKLNRVLLDNADLFLALSDTAAVDTATSAPVNWNVCLKKVDLKNSKIRMSMPGDSMRIAFHVENMLLRNGVLDLGKGDYSVETFKLHHGGLSYLVRPSWQAGDSGNTAFLSADSLAWSGFVPSSEGLDPNYLVLDDLCLGMKAIGYHSDGSMSATLANFFVKERGGAQIEKIQGNLLLEDGKLSLENGVIQTPTSHLDLMVEMYLEAFSKKSQDYGKVTVNGELSAVDVATLGKGFVDNEILKVWPDYPLKINLKVVGDTNSVQVDTFLLDWPHILNAKLKGEIIHPMSDHCIGQLDFNLASKDMTFVNHLLKDENPPSYVVPSDFLMQGKVNINGDNYRLKSKSVLNGGDLNLEGHLNFKSQTYQASVSSAKFPLQLLLPGSGLGPLSANFSAKGHGFDALKKSTELQADLLLDSLQMNEWQLGQMRLSANMKEGLALMNFESSNDLLGGEGSLEVRVGDTIQMKFRSEIPDVNLQNIMTLKSPLSLGATFSVDAYTNRSVTTYGFEGSLKNMRFITAEKGIPARDVKFRFDTSSDTTLMRTSSGDLDLRLIASGGIDQMLEKIVVLSTTLQNQLVSKQLNQEKLKEISPIVDFHLRSGKTNPMANILREMGYVYDDLTLDLSMSPNRGAKGDLRLSAFNQNKLLLDTLTIQLQQDSTGLVANGWVKNFTKKNKTKFEGNLKTYLLDSGAGAEIQIRNEDGIMGMDFGILANMKPEGMYLHVYPEHPIIAFRNFTINKENHLFLGKDSTITADIDLLADDGTGLRVYSQNVNSVNDITFSINQLNLADLSFVMPYLPKLAGKLSGDLHMLKDQKDISAMATMEVANMAFEGADLGNIGMEAIYLPQNGNEHHANIYVSSEGDEVLSLGGIYKDQAGNEGFEGSAELLDFPLDLLNGFLIGTDLAMSGNASGKLSVSGSMSSPMLNGELLFDKAHLRSDVYGFDFRMDDQPVRMIDNQLVLNDFGLYSKENANPLLMSGSLDMRNFSKIKLDFGMEAKNFELINAKKNNSSLVFGKVYTDFWGTLKGTMEDLRVRGKLSILDRTDMTYILKDSPLTVDDRLHDLVQFVSFEDSVAEEEIVVEPSVNFDMKLGISINDAALFHCNLSEDGSNYVDLEGGGDLTLRITQQGDMRLTGRFTANSGKMKYSLPVIPLKTFKLVQGSYVDFTGDVANPTLNIAAKERMKAIVTENDQPRSVAFDVGVSITQPLDQMGLEFTIEAPEDLAVQNQLATMTKAQRGKTAVGMLATGLYLTDESMSSGNAGFKASNALTAFLQSEIQNIAGNALKTIDLTIGMENNTSTTGATTTDYSFQFAKRFWGNRISVIVGGKVSTGAEAENSAESFIDNIAIEYRLDKTASRYVRVFYERSFQDPLEGQLTKTGAGLVLRRKSDRLGELFIFRNKENKKNKSDKK